jgi:hypothetical protein
MPPLTTPATAVLFMIAFLVVMMGVPLLILRVAHHRSLPSGLAQTTQVDSSGVKFI